ncbi:unnamed protein product [Hymenolepis diminuta]|uniref:Uncharacterized protein n=1 Tax=Hymenolepis diminuta TaxID=6216 RepID=A0A564Y493_HYMDI|nr:unnamed protein product [Hymenolepis diminuta]
MMNVEKWTRFWMTAMIELNAGEDGFVRKIAQPSRKRNRQENISNQKPPSSCWLYSEVPFCRDCPYRNRNCDVYGKEGLKETKCRSDRKGHLNKKIAGKPIGSFNSLSFVNSTYEARSSNR